MHACALPERPTLAYFHFENLRQSNFRIRAGPVLVSIYSG